LFQAGRKRNNNFLLSPYENRIQVLNISAGIAQEIEFELLASAIQRILYINRNDNIMWNFMSRISCLPAKYIDNQSHK